MESTLSLARMSSVPSSVAEGRAAQPLAGLMPRGNRETA